jgi:hypothetical protein
MLDNDGALLPEKKAIHAFSTHVPVSRFTSLPVMVPEVTHHVIVFSSLYIARSYHGLVSLKHHVAPHHDRVCTTSSKNAFSGHITN